MTTVVQKAHGGITFGGTTGSATFGSNVTGGNAIIVAIVFRDTGDTAWSGYTVSVSDSVCPSFAAKADGTFFFSAPSRNSVCAIFAGAAASSGADTVAVSIAGLTSCKGGGVFIYEVAGLGSLTPESTGSGETVGGGSVSTSNVSWSSATPFLVSAIDSIDSGAGIFTPGNANFSVQTDTSQNDTFGSLYAIGIAADFTSPSNFTVGSSLSNSGAFEVAAAFPSASAATLMMANIGRLMGRG
jgi:hypothetical protein